MIVEAYNPDTDELERTTLSIAPAAGVTSLTVKNNNNFVNTDLILIGEMGFEKTELSSITGAVTPGTALTVNTTLFPHNTDDPIYKMLFNKVRFYRSTTGIGGTYSLLATVDMDVDNEEKKTLYNDLAGVPGYYYTISFYNSVTSQESEQSDPIAGAGYDTMSAGAIIDQVMTEVGDKEGTTAGRDEYFPWLNEVNYALQKRMRKPYDFLKARVAKNPAIGAGIDYPTDVLHFDTIKYTYTVGAYSRVYNPIPVYEDEWNRLNENPSSVVNNDQIEYIYFDDVDEKIYTYPKFATAQTGTFVINYWKKFTYIDSDGDLLETVDPQVYKAYLKGNYYRKKAAREERFAAVSDRWFSDYQVELAQIVKYNRKNIGKPQEFRVQRRPSLRNYRGAR